MSGQWIGVLDAKLMQRAAGAPAVCDAGAWPPLRRPLSGMGEVHS